MGKMRKSFPRFRREGAAPRVNLTDDDVGILRHVYRHRFIRADDLYRLFEGRSEDRLSRRFTILFRAGFLDRPRAQIDRFRVEGSQPFVYGLGTDGAKYLKEHEGMPIGPSNWRARNRDYTRDNLEHTLAVSHFLVDLELSCRRSKEVKLIPFEDILSHAPKETQRSKTPGKWPVPVQWSSGRTEVVLAPDAIFGLRVERENKRPMTSFVFLEIDRGTMTIAPTENVRGREAFLYRSTVLRKFLTYATSWKHNFHSLHFGVPSPRMVMLTTSKARATSMRQAAMESVIRPQRLPAGLFLFGVLDAENPLSMEMEDCAGCVSQLLPIPSF